MSNENIIKLNVGGAQFQTSKSTLIRFDGFFKTMLETEIPLTKDDSGAIFIDRDPAHFPRILNFMRDGDVELPKNSEDVKDLQKEAQFYLLEGLVELCKSIIKSSVAPLVKRSFFAESDKELADMIANSTKKVICVYYYNPCRCNILSLTTTAMLKYGRKIDFCLRENISYECLLYNNETNRVDHQYSYGDLEAFIKQCIPNIDEY